MKKYERVYASINMDAIRHNIDTIAGTLKEGTGICAVLKADAYGHGAAETVRFLEKMKPVTYYAVATVDEANILREAGGDKPILILGACFPKQYEELVAKEYRTNVFRYDLAKALSDEGIRQRKNVYIHIGLDTGMNRLGFLIDDNVVNEIEAISKLPNIVIEGIFTHFVSADDEDKSFTYEQIDRYNSVIDELERRGINIPIKHIANSAGTLDIEKAQLNMVRVGIIMYGIYPTDYVSHELKLWPALELKSTVSFIKTVKKGEKISYGGTYTCPKDELIATIPVGYGDGYPRSLSNKGYVLINGQKAPIRGRICMDQLMVDVTDIKDVTEWMEVTLLGKDGDEIITAEYIGELSNRFSYEFVCDLGKRIPRVYTLDGVVIASSDYFYLVDTL